MTALCVLLRFACGCVCLCVLLRFACDCVFLCVCVLLRFTCDCVCVLLRFACDCVCICVLLCFACDRVCVRAPALVCVLRPLGAIRFPCTYLVVRVLIEIASSSLRRVEMARNAKGAEFEIKIEGYAQRAGFLPPVSAGRRGSVARIIFLISHQAIAAQEKITSES